MVNNIGSNIGRLSPSRSPPLGRTSAKAQLNSLEPSPKVKTYRAPQNFIQRDSYAQAIGDLRNQQNRKKINDCGEADPDTLEDYQSKRVLPITVRFSKPRRSDLNDQLKRLQNGKVLGIR